MRTNTLWRFAIALWVAVALVSVVLWLRRWELPPWYEVVVPLAMIGMAYTSQRSPAQASQEYSSRMVLVLILLSGVMMLAGRMLRLLVD